LQLRRVHLAADLFFALQTEWLDAELRKVHARADPRHVCLIAADFLVVTMLQLLARQRGLLQIENVVTTTPASTPSAASEASAATARERNAARREGAGKESASPSAKKAAAAA